MKKRSAKRKTNNFEKKIERDFKKVEKTVEKDVKEVEAWIYQRRRFLIKLGCIALFIVLLLLVAKFLL